METYRKITNGLDKIVTWICILLFSIMVFAAGAQILARYVIGNSLEWSEELARYMFIWSVLLGSSMVAKRRGHVGVEIVMMSLPEKIRNYATVLADVLSMVFYGIIIVKGVEVSQVTMMQFSPANEIRMGLVYASIPVSGIIMMVYTIEHLIEDLKKLSATPTSASLAQGGK